MRDIGVQIKVCGVTRVDDANAAVDFGVDYLGLNFWPGSPRCVDVHAASRIAAAVIGQVSLVGLWVDPTIDEMESVARVVDLDYFQIHGQESPELIDRFAEKTIKAFRVVEEFGSEDLRPSARVWGFLFDCAPAGSHGGSGRSWPYERIAHLKPARPAFVAGGLTPSNVGRAVRKSGLTRVDVCSGVESQPGIKDRELLKRFVEEVRNVSQKD